MPPLSPFTRYYDIIDDVPAFEKTLHSRSQRSIWTNRLRITPNKPVKFLENDGHLCKPLPWSHQAFRLSNGGAGLGRHWSYAAGLFNIQEASAMLPAIVLDPQPGERVLDLCAAPGNKTVQLALAMQNSGTVVANDPDYRRLRPVRMMIDRLGLINVSTTCWDGTTYPGAAGPFDRILVDVPCSCEGTFRKSPKLLAGTTPLEKFSRKQTALLQRAVRLCRPGGRIVYSTCTFSPEENEMVVQSILNQWPDDLILRPISVTGLTASSGLDQWEGIDFTPDLRHCRRIWPYHHDSDGFFIALLEKTRTATSGSSRLRHSPDSADKLKAAPERVIDPSTIYAYLAIRFGVAPEVFESLQLVSKKDRDTYAVAADHNPPFKPRPATGLPFVHTSGRFFKLSTAAAMAFGVHAQHNIIDVSSSQLKAYLARKSIIPTAGQLTHCTGNGHVLIRFEKFVFGVGFYRKDPKGIESLYPKSMAIGK